MEEIIKLFYNSLEKPTNVKGILLSTFIEEDKIIWKYDNPNDLSFNTYVLETCVEDLFYDFCKQAEIILIPTFPIFWDIDSPKTLYINEELKSKIERSLLEIKDLSYWDDNNSNLVCKSQMDYWELSQEFSETIFLEVGFNIYDILIDKVPVDSIKANKWLEGYMHAEDANVEAQYLLDETSCIIFEEETVADESYMNIAISIYETCIEDNLTPTSVAFIAKEEEVSDDNKVEILKTYHDNGQIKEEIETVNDKRHGLYKSYHDNGQLRVAVRFENGHQVDGAIDSFDENGILIRSVEIINGNLNGPFKEFYPSGNIKKVGEYKDDEIIGKPKEYFEDGSVKENNEDEVLELDNKNCITFIDKTAFLNKLKNLDESSIIEIRFDSEKWSINDKATVTGIWNGKNYILYANEWIKNAELIWEETLDELINMLTDNELEDIDSNNCWLGLEGSDGSNIDVNKIEWEPLLSIEDEKKFKDEYGDGIKLFREGQVDNDMFFEAGAIIGISVITEDEEFHLTVKIDDSEEDDEELNFSDMKLIIKELKVETVLVDFVNSWNKYVGGEYNQLEIETIYDDLDSERDYNGELFSITMDKENNCLILEIDSPFEAFPLINELYNYNYLMITKSLARIISKDFDYNFENDDYEELEYTIFTAEDSLEYDNEIVFKGGEYKTKLHMSKADWDSYDIEDIDISDDFNLLKYQTVHFVSKKEFAEGNWFQTIKSFDLYDWDTYPSEF